MKFNFEVKRVDCISSNLNLCYKHMFRCVNLLSKPKLPNQLCKVNKTLFMGFVLPGDYKE